MEIPKERRFNGLNLSLLTKICGLVEAPAVAQVYDIRLL